MKHARAFLVGFAVASLVAVGGAQVGYPPQSPVFSSPTTSLAVPFTAGPLTVSATAVTSTVPFLAPNGTQAAPSQSFANDTTSGWYIASAGDFRGSSGNFTFLSAISGNVILNTATALQWASSGVAAADVSLSRGAANRLDLATGDSFYMPAASTGQILAPDGTGAAPSIRFTSQATGLFYAGTSQIGVAINGVQRVLVNGAANTFTLDDGWSFNWSDVSLSRNNGALNVNTTGRFTGQTNPSSGVGLEVAYGSSTGITGGILRVYDRTGAAYGTLLLNDGWQVDANQDFLDRGTNNMQVNGGLGVGVAPGAAGTIQASGTLDISGAYIAINNAGAYLNFNSAAKINNPGAAKLNFINNADTAGVGLDFATDGTLKIRNRAQSADAAIAASIASVSSYVDLLGQARLSTTSDGNVRVLDGAGSAYSNLLVKSVRGDAVAFASVPAAPVEGMLVAVTDSSTATWGATITGGGANHVLAYYNGTNWTVAGK